MRQFTGKIGQTVGAAWDAENRMSWFIEGNPHDATGVPTEAYRYDAQGYRWLRWSSDGTARVTLRDAAGQPLADFDVTPTATVMTTEYIHGAGQLLAERLPANQALAASGLGAATGATEESFDSKLGGSAYTSEVMTDIRTAKGFVGGGLVTPDAQGRFTIAHAAFVPGMTNFVRVKPAHDPAAPYSAPVAVVVDPDVTSSSPNQVRSMSVSRAGTNIVLKWSQLSSNGKKTHVYFRRTDTGVATQLTLQALTAGLTQYIVPSQALAAPDGAFFSRQVNVNQSLTDPSDDVANPGTDPGFGPPGGGGGGGGGGGSTGTTPAFVDRYHHRDHLGSLRLVTDESGQVARDASGAKERHDFYPFGQEMVASGGTYATGSRKKFTGHERDEGSGLDYMLARYQSAALGRFLSVDPGFDSHRTRPTSWNLYGYVNGNALVATDPTGRREQWAMNLQSNALFQKGYDALSKTLDGAKLIAQARERPQLIRLEAGRVYDNSNILALGSQANGTISPTVRQSNTVEQRPEVTATINTEYIAESNTADPTRAIAETAGAIAEELMHALQATDGTSTNNQILAADQDGTEASDAQDEVVATIVWDVLAALGKAPPRLGSQEQKDAREGAGFSQDPK